MPGTLENAIMMGSISILPESMRTISRDLWIFEDTLVRSISVFPVVESAEMLSNRASEKEYPIEHRIREENIANMTNKKTMSIWIIISESSRSLLPFLGLSLDRNRRGKFFRSLPRI